MSGSEDPTTIRLDTTIVVAKKPRESKALVIAGAFLVFVVFGAVALKVLSMMSVPVKSVASGPSDQELFEAMRPFADAEADLFDALVKALGRGDFVTADLINGPLDDFIEQQKILVGASLFSEFAPADVAKNDEYVSRLASTAQKTVEIVRARMESSEKGRSVLKALGDVGIKYNADVVRKWLDVELFLTPQKWDSYMKLLERELTSDTFAALCEQQKKIRMLDYFRTKSLEARLTVKSAAVAQSRRKRTVRRGYGRTIRRPGIIEWGFSDVFCGY